MSAKNGEKLVFPLKWKEIHDLLPHRYPFLLIDRVTKGELLDGGKGSYVEGYKNVSFNEDFFNGHFAYMPVMPGVLQLEALSQLAAVLAYMTADFDTSSQTPFLMSMDNVKFRRPVEPGDRLDMRVEQVIRKSKLIKAYCVASVDGSKTCEMTVTAGTIDKKAAFGKKSQLENSQLGYRPYEQAMVGTGDVLD
ncbi:MAG: beta-hydroxyacyl-ACP dehydratase [Deltaproteobacteria bacterium]|nr:beta-hydroxyacyl-ACP dehydratase [Deltaproteobacteria bacterium]